MIYSGFSTFRSTADLLTVLSERIYNYLDVGSETRAIVLESKEFDEGWHAGLRQAESIWC